MTKILEEGIGNYFETKHGARALQDLEANIKAPPMFQYLNKNLNLPFFAEAVGMTRKEATGVSIEDIGKCFRKQFDEVELSQLIHELNKSKI
jgi:hypothetical protein